MKQDSDKIVLYIFFIIFLSTISLALIPQLGHAQVPVRILENGNLLLDDFSQDDIGSMPSKWYVRDGNVRLKDLAADKKSKYRYRVVEEDGRKYIRYSGMDAMHIGLPIHETSEINLSTHPVLSWEWRVHAVPAGALRCQRIPICRKEGKKFSS